ncbi:uncharacterized protein LOC126263186 [Schistocerca nitens]|uniref:uncharacterized protein LOC126263186 n=1 Tax=Schistocerca nitens TaxID=7011 RepID=UPI0021195379|nr:uncharacterized protein LOC126263186 [Schistocerca nitens]
MSLHSEVPRACGSTELRNYYDLATACDVPDGKSRHYCNPGMQCGRSIAAGRRRHQLGGEFGGAPPGGSTTRTGRRCLRRLRHRLLLHHPKCLRSMLLERQKTCENSGLPAEKRTRTLSEVNAKNLYKKMKYIS